MNTRLKCLLLDDELPGLSYLKLLCEQIPELEVVKAFTSPQAFISESGSLDFHLAILDIEMPGISGLEVAAQLKDKCIIFTTAYKEHAAEAFNMDAVDYVTKPVKKERLQEAVLKAQARLATRNKGRLSIQLNTDQGKSLIFFDHLCYVVTAEGDSRDKTAYLSDGTIVTLKNISYEKLQELLPARHFCRINKKELIALRTVKAFSSDEITIQLPFSGSKPLRLTLSEVFRKEFLEKVNI